MARKSIVGVGADIFASVLARMPISDWGRGYSRETLHQDLLAALIVSIMMIPQSLAYAMLAGLPAEAGIYASVLPTLLYALFGSSRALAVGPVAVISLMTAAAVGGVVQQGTAGYAAAALTLAFLSGGMLLIMGIFRLGVFANFLSHSVVSGFITASGILIAASQFKLILGVKAEGDTLPELVPSILSHLGQVSLLTLIIGLAAIAFLFWVRRGGLKAYLLGKGVAPKLADIAGKAGPVAAVFVTTMLVWILGLDGWGVAIVGEVPQSLPPFTFPDLKWKLLSDLFVPALLISIIGFVESISVAQTLAAKKRQRIDPDQELIGLGMANLGAAFSGGYPVTGGFSRSVVNFDAGAATPAAGAYTAFGLGIAALALTPMIYFLPKATLAATIIVAVLSLVDFSVVWRAWSYARADFAAVAATILATLGWGVEAGVSAGVILSLVLVLYRTSRPHVAEVGLVPGTEHFRNIHRHAVLTDPTLVTLRVDESLYFANAMHLEELMLNRVAADCPVKNVVLMCTAVNEIDLSALEALEAINTRFKEMGIGFHLSEVKGPVMDRLKRADFLNHLNGQVFLTQFQAWEALRRPVPSAIAAR